MRLNSMRLRLFAWTIALLVISGMNVAAAETAANSVTIAVTGDVYTPDVKVVSDSILAHMAQTEVAAVLIAGDTNNAGSTPLESYQKLYKETYDRFLEKIRPCPGNHDALSKPPFSGYLAFWGEKAHAPEMYYSFDLGGWHIICLDSVTLVNGDDSAKGDSEKGGPAKKGKRAKGKGKGKGKRAKDGSAKEDHEKAVAQLAWLKNDLAANPNKPVFVQWHYPYFSHAKHLGQPKMKPFFDLLYAHGPAIVLVGHNHVYERFAPLDPDGNVVAETKGIQQFQVCPGGAKPITKEDPDSPGPASFKFHGGTQHVGYFTLHADGGYRFTIDSIESSGKTTVIDTGSGNLLGGPAPQ